MIKTIPHVIPPSAYRGPVPKGYNFTRFDEYQGRVVGIAKDGTRVVIPQASHWEEDDDTQS